MQAHPGTESGERIGWANQLTHSFDQRMSLPHFHVLLCKRGMKSAKVKLTFRYDYLNRYNYWNERILDWSVSEWDFRGYPVSEYVLSDCGTRLKS